MICVAPLEMPLLVRSSRTSSRPVIAVSCVVRAAVEDVLVDTVWALSIRPKMPEIPSWEANGTVFFRNFIPKFWVYLARLA